MSELPGRSLIGFEWLPPHEPGQARALLTCDCGTATDLTVQVDGRLPGKAEAAFTCDGCRTTHWFTVTATGDGDG